MHWAAHGHTAAEIIAGGAEASRPNMGLTSWIGAKPSREDTEIAKNYLNHEELDTFNRIVTMYLDFAELQALNRKPMHMRDWITRLDDFLRISDRDILTHAGRTGGSGKRCSIKRLFHEIHRLKIPHRCFRRNADIQYSIESSGTCRYRRCIRDCNDFIDEWKRAEAGETGAAEHKLHFENLEILLKTLTAGRWILQKIGCPESFTEPLQVYSIAKSRAMDLVTITDHNSIDGALQIAHLPDTFISEELVCDSV
jgi:hypothetical protein